MSDTCKGSKYIKLWFNIKETLQLPIDLRESNPNSLKTNFTIEEK